MKSLKLTLTYLAAGLTALSPVAMAAPQQASKQEVNDYLSYYVTGPNKTFNDLYSKNHSLFDQRSRSLIETWLEKYGNEKAPQVKATTVRDDKGQERLQITMKVSGETVTIAESNDPGYIMVNGQKINMEQTRDITGLFNELGKNNPDYKQMAAQLDQTTVPMTVHDGGLTAEQFVRLNPEQKVQYLMLLRKQMEAVEKVINGSVQSTASMMNSDKVYAYGNNGVVFKGSVWDLLGSAAAYAEQSAESKDLNDLRGESTREQSSAPTPAPTTREQTEKSSAAVTQSDSVNQNTLPSGPTLAAEKNTKSGKGVKSAVIPTPDFTQPPIGFGGTTNAIQYYGGDSRAPASISIENIGWPVGSSCIVAGNIGLIKNTNKHKSCNPILTSEDQQLADKQKQPTIPKDVFKNNQTCANQTKNSKSVACNPIIYGYNTKDELFCVSSKAANFSTQATEMCNSQSPLNEECAAAPSNGGDSRAYTKQCLGQFRNLLESYYKHNNKNADISSCFDSGNRIKKDAKNNNQNCLDLFKTQMGVYNDLKLRAKYVCSASNAISKFPGQKEACDALGKRVLALELYADSVSPDGGTTTHPVSPTNPIKHGKKKFCDNSSTGIKSFLCEPKFWAGVGIGIGASVLACKTHMFGLCRKKTRTVTNTLTNTIYVPTPIVVPPPATEGGSGTGSGTSGGVRTDGSN